MCSIKYLESVKLTKKQCKEIKRLMNLYLDVFKANKEIKQGKTIPI